MAGRARGRDGRGMIQIEKNRRETILIRQRVYEGRLYVDVRLHFTGDDGNLHPTRQGVTISLDKAGDLADAIRAVEAQETPDAE